MSIKSDKWIRRMAEQHGMIEPFEPGQIRQNAAGQKIVSYGTSSYGYDIRCAPEFKVFTNIYSTVVDPKNFDEKSFVDINSDVCIIPPNSFALARTVEYFRIPRNVLTVCLGKSTYARCGIIVNVTPFEPEWEGYVTLEFSNTTPLPAKIYAGEGCAQVLFFESDEVCETSYKDRGGKYQGQYYFPQLVTPYNKTITRTNGSRAKVMAFFDSFDGDFHTILQGGTGNGVTTTNQHFSFNESRAGLS